MNRLSAFYTFVILVIIVDYVLADGVISFNRNQFQEKREQYQLCQDNRTKCTTKETCCAMDLNSDSCCSYPNAVCCPDKLHCCPQDSTCDMERHQCVKSNDAMWKLIPSNNLIGSKQRLNSLELPSQIKIGRDQTCPNNKTKCKDTKTCCITKHGNYYCCPHQNAVCCSDKYQCCPEGTTCDLENKKCINSLSHIDTYSHGENVNQPHNLRPARKSGYGNLVWKLEKQCSNNKYKCPGEKKCCPMLGGTFGCCKFDKGTCCGDMKTCCPHGTECDVTNNKCTAAPQNLLPLSKDNTDLIRKPSETVCPDKKMDCRTFETCCSVGYGMYGCCPYKNATCCSDNASCCPHNKKCDLKNKMCVKQEELISDFVKRKSLISYLSDVGLKGVCPDGNRCQGNETCCQTTNIDFGCCPFDFGVCCPDHKTCCSQGYMCVDNGCSKKVI